MKLRIFLLSVLGLLVIGCIAQREKTRDANDHYEVKKLYEASGLYYDNQKYDSAVIVGEKVHGMFFMNWSINEWEDARRGDMYYMMRVGDDKAGIVFYGQFITDPYPEDDWKGSTKRKMYVDMVCMELAELGTKPRLSLEKLQESIPAYEWSKGHSGVLIIVLDHETNKKEVRVDFQNHSFSKGTMVYMFLMKYSMASSKGWRSFWTTSHTKSVLISK